MAARKLAEEFGGDRGAADWRHFGRLAGFTNRKEKYMNEGGLFPFVRLIEASGLAIQRGSVLSRRSPQKERSKSAPERTGVASPFPGGRLSRASMIFDPIRSTAAMRRERTWPSRSMHSRMGLALTKSRPPCVPAIFPIKATRNARTSMSIAQSRKALTVTESKCRG